MKDFVAKAKQKTRFLQGIGFGVFLTSFMSYAAVTLNKTYTTGTAISSSSMNQNFNWIEGAVNGMETVLNQAVTDLTNLQFQVANMQKKYIFNSAGNITVTCGTMEPVYLSPDANSAPYYSNGNGQITIPQAAVYFVHGESTFSNGMSGVNMEISKDNGSTWASSMYNGTFLLNTNDKIRFHAFCTGGTDVLSSIHIEIHKL